MGWMFGSDTSRSYWRRRKIGGLSEVVLTRLMQNSCRRCSIISLALEARYQWIDMAISFSTQPRRKMLSQRNLIRDSVEISMVSLSLSVKVWMPIHQGSSTMAKSQDYQGLRRTPHLMHRFSCQTSVRSYRKGPKNMLQDINHQVILILTVRCISHLLKYLHWDCLMMIKLRTRQNRIWWWARRSTLKGIMRSLNS